MSLAARGSFVLLTLAACEGKSNVRACEAFVASQGCPGYDFESAFDCEVYRDQPCDLDDWFGCLTEHTTCGDPAEGPLLDVEPCAHLSCER